MNKRSGERMRMIKKNNKIKSGQNRKKRVGTGKSKTTFQPFFTEKEQN